MAIFMTADLDFPGLLVLGHFANKIDVEQAMFITCASDLDGICQLEAPFESALGDPPMEELAFGRFRSFLGAAGDDHHVFLNGQKIGSASCRERVCQYV